MPHWVIFIYNAFNVWAPNALRKEMKRAGEVRIVISPGPRGGRVVRISGPQSSASE
jgi:hypothetical protein